MPLRIESLPEHRIILMRMSGLVTARDILTIPDWMEDERNPLGWPWLSVFAPDADLSEIALVTLTELKCRLIRAFDRRGRPPERVRNALVSTSGLNDPVISLWRSFAASDPEHPAEPMMTRTVEAAAAWIGADEAALAELRKRLDGVFAE